MEALGDGVIFGESPHAGDGLGPILKGLSEGLQLREWRVFEFVDNL